jgi:hypothetical protein
VLKSVEFKKWIDVPGGWACGVTQGLRMKFVTQQLCARSVRPRPKDSKLSMFTIPF